MQGRYFQKTEQNKIKCLLCPNACLISEGQHGICRVRYNRGGELVLPYYGRLSSLAMDPIEKKPLYHFFPGTQILSVGFWGCSFHCPFCQNYSISQATNEYSQKIVPDELVEKAQKTGSAGIAYTYSEPLIHFEYVMDTARLAREKGLKNVLVSNGYINTEPASELLEFIDAANIDLKTFNPEFYRKEIGGKLEEVKRFISQAAGTINLEVTTLVIPTKNDTEKEIEEISRFLAGINDEIPYHLSCYYPTYKYNIPPTSTSLVKHLAKVAKRHLKYVYLGNVGFEETNTLCPECGNLLIRRRGYFITMQGVKNGRCSKCNAVIPIPGLN
jgi:pyruvate formate lyase activating enzyme